MDENTSHTPRRWEREAAHIPIKLVLKAERFKADNSAITVDVSLRGMRVQTNLTLIPGEWVGVVPKGGFPHAIPARVVWAREDEVSHWVFAGIEFLQTAET
jgi:ATP-dependent protease Clp ATPase subunit